MHKLLMLCLLIAPTAFSQVKEAWINKPQEEWPQIALVNEVLYKNGDSYEDPSLKEIGYAGTAFLIDTGKDTVAATAKHVLWVARNKNKNSVSINEDLEKWVMHPKENTKDVVIVDQLINEDDDEILLGDGSSIMERDWLIFSIKKASKAIYPLKPRYTMLKPGEKVYRMSNPYSTGATVVYESTVIRTEGRDILLETDTTMLKPGASGSPIIDAHGYLVGISSSAFEDAKSGKDVEIAVSTLYLRDVLEGKQGLNAPKKSVYEKLYAVVQRDGVEEAIEVFKKISANEDNYFTYNLRMSERELSRLGDQLIKTGKIEDAIKIFEFNASIRSSWFAWNDLGKAYMLLEDTAKAKEAYEKSFNLYKNEEALNALEQLKNTNH